MIDKIISALESMQEDMEEHGELQKARGVSSAIWLIEIMRDWADRKTEQTESKTCNNCKLKGTTEWCKRQEICRAYQPKDEPNCSEIPDNCEPQTETEVIRTIIHKMIDNTDLAEDAYPGLRQRLHDAVDEYEPQTDCAWR